MLSKLFHKSLKLLGWATLIGYGAYLLGANFVINSKILRSAVNTWKDGEVQYSWGISPLPGVVFIRHFYIAHEDKNVRWNLTLNWVRTAVSLFDLLDSKFHSYSIVADGGRFVFVEKKRLENPKSAETALLPAVNAPKKEAPAEPSSGKAKKWGLHLASVTVRHLSEAWVNQYRVLGDLALKGQVEVIPYKSVEVGPAEVSFQNAETFLGPRPIGTKLEGTVQYKMDPFHPDALDPEIFRSMSMDANLRLNARHLEPINLFFRKATWLGLSDTDAEIVLRVILRNGLLQPGTEVTMLDAPLAVKLGPYQVGGKARLRIGVEGEGKEQALHLRSAVEGLSLKGKDREAAVQGGTLRIHGTTTGLSLVDELFVPLKLDLNLTGPVPSLARLNHLFPEDSALKFEKGQAMVSAEFHADSSVPAQDHGLVLVNADNAGVDLRGMPLLGRLEGKFPFQQSNLEEGLFRVQDARVSLVSENNKWVGRADIPHMTAHISKQTKIDGEVKVEATSSRPFLDFAKKQGLSGLLAALIDVTDIRSRGRFEMRPKTVVVKNFYLDSSSLSVRGDYEGFGSNKKGRFLVVKEPFAVGVELTPGKKTRIILNDAFKWYGTFAE